MSAKLKGEGEVTVWRETKVRVRCEVCDEPATTKHTFLLNDARINPASSAYGRDDCTFCSDYDFYTCDRCRPDMPNGHESCARFPADQFPHMFLRLRRERIDEACGDARRG